MLVEIDESSPVPLYLQIAASIRRSIAGGVVAAGGRLPASRDMAAALEVNVNTVQRAYGELRDEGLLQLRQGRGAAGVGGAGGGNGSTGGRAWGELGDEGLLQLRQGRGAVVVSGEVRRLARLH